MENNLENLTIGVFAKAAGVNVETIRFYQRKGLLREPDKPYGSIRRYGEADVVRVKFVKSAQRLGFSLDEIAELLRLDYNSLIEKADIIHLSTVHVEVEGDIKFPIMPENFNLVFEQFFMSNINYTYQIWKKG